MGAGASCKRESKRPRNPHLSHCLQSVWLVLCDLQLCQLPKNLRCIVVGLPPESCRPRAWNGLPHQDLTRRRQQKSPKWQGTTFPESPTTPSFPPTGVLGVRSLKGFGVPFGLIEGRFEVDMVMDGIER